MKMSRFVLALLLGHFALAPLSAQNSPFQSGSTGADLAFAPTVSTNVQLPPSGRLNYTNVFIPASVTVTFTRNAANTPVYLLATGDVEIHGNISVDGEIGTSLRGGFGGPGGFAGGMPGIAGNPPGDGLGPGGGRGNVDPTRAGRGVYGAAFPANNARAGDGSVYGSQLLIPLVGGSGGGGQPGAGGGGGGGAILIASSTVITNRGQINAAGGANSSGGAVGWGSGGAIRLVAPVISGTGSLNVSGPIGNFNAGRIRCDLIDRRFFGANFLPGSAVVTANEAFMLTFPPSLPSLRLLRVAGTDVPSDAPAGFTVTLPFNAPAQQLIVLEAAGFGTQVPVTVRLTPDSGPAMPLITDIIRNDASDPATLSVLANFPPNIPVTVEAWAP